MKPPVAATAILVGMTAASVAVWQLSTHHHPPGLRDCDKVMVRAYQGCAEPDGGMTYAAYRTRAWVCPEGVAGLDAGLILPQSSRKGCAVFRPESVVILDGGCTDSELCGASDAEMVEKEDVFDCACWDMAAGPCDVRLSDGGFRSAHRGVTLPPGTWHGAGCVRKACGEVFGHSSMPKECRTRGIQL